ncbi:PXA domain-containing protein [Lipomyces oligophaga]|uniref:PXA domain-containing protein n=1 Tax=Lipomyces oligophaga TaxID=45792 RepID=UPI0034CF571E
MTDAQKHDVLIPGGLDCTVSEPDTHTSFEGARSFDHTSHKKLDKELQTDDATATLIRNILVPPTSLSKPLDETLPALSSFPDIDFELYAFIALILRQFVLGWYIKITGDDISDRTFISEVTQVIAHVTRSLEERLRKVELEMLLLDDIPFVLDAHIRDFRLARQKVGSAYAAGKSFEEMFHALQPHPALIPPDTSKDAATQERQYLSVLSKGVISVLLPTDDLRSSNERTFICSLLADVVFNTAIDKISEPFMVHEIISKVIEKSLKCKTNDGEEPAVSASVPKKSTGTTSSNRFQDILSEILSSIKVFISSAVTFLSLLQAGIVFFISFARTIPDESTESTAASPHGSPASASLLTIALFPTIARLLNLGARQPWLMSTIELLALPLVLLPPGSIIDRLLIHFFRTYVLTSSTVCSVLRAARTAVFPNNDPMGPPRVYPSPDEQQAILERLRKNILRIVPGKVRSQVLGDDAMDGIQELIAPFESKYANKHLIYFLIDIIIVKVLPELTEQTPEHLKRWRLGEDLDPTVYY